MYLRILIGLLMLTLSGCTFAPKLSLEEVSCPGELTTKLEALSSAVQKASTACLILGDSNG